MRSVSIYKKGKDMSQPDIVEYELGIITQASRVISGAAPRLATRVGLGFVVAVNVRQETRRAATCVDIRPQNG